MAKRDIGLALAVIGGYFGRAGGAAMIARHWHGRVPAALAADYLKLMRDVALPDYRGIAGNVSALCLHRAEGDVVHVEMLTLWEGEAAIRRFAGEDMTLAKYYDFDPDYLLELETSVRHYEVIEGQGGNK